ncbi:hypothetical protein [Streptomyces sp. 4R-3d]|uniref:hypothetical protein n=1 Tax=Streptomyces sp. 4R-3d TaxID=2559605 RepID=UPI001FFE1B0A|nr:hypothetical protein [Streptomyces sp. 4R-3d]
MPPTAIAPAPAPVDVEQAEAALVEHYPRLVRIAYLVLPPALGRNRRVLTAHAVVQRSLPRSRSAATPDDGYTYVRGRVLRQALDAGRPLRRVAWPRRAQLPPLLPHVWGLRLFPRSGGADELALDQRLSALSGGARAAFVLRGLERLADRDVRRLLTDAGIEDPHAALAEADGIGTKGVALLESPEYDACSLQARPTDLLRRRQHARAAVVGVAAVAVCGALLGLPGDGWGANGAAAPPYARNSAAEAALDPAKVHRVPENAWRSAARTDFSVWPTRGALADDRPLLRRALAVWARPGASVRVSSTPATPVGPPMGPAQLLYAGEVDRARVVLLYDGLRIARYAEPRTGTGPVALDFARVDGASADTAPGAAPATYALVAGRTDGNVRYLTAPWVATASVRDLLDPAGDARPLRRGADGVTNPLPVPGANRECGAWDVLEVTESGEAGGVRLLSDLGELTPARLTSGPPSAPADVSGTEARTAWARTACLLPAVRSHGVRTVNSWQFAGQSLPESNGAAQWVCTRAETWRGAESRVLAQFQPPSAKAGAPRTGAVAARASGSPACGAREPHVLAGVLWKSRGGRWYVLAAGSDEFRSVRTTGGVTGEARGRVLAVPAKPGDRAELDGLLADGTRVGALR